MNKKNLEKIRKRLLERRSRLRTEINRFTEVESRNLASSEIGDLQDEASRDVEMETAWMVTEMESRELAEVEDALHRLEKGKFGICDGCGKTIHFRRLNALPFARSCIDSPKSTFILSSVRIFKVPSVNVSRAISLFSPKHSRPTSVSELPPSE